MILGRPSQSELRKHASAIALVVAVTLIMIVIGRIDSDATPYVVMTFPVLIAAWLGGWGPGLLATGLGLIAVRYALPVQSRDTSPYTGVIFVIEGLLISWIADQRRIEQSHGQISREQLRLLHEGIDDCALFMLDRHGRIDDWNDRAERMFGYAATDIIGESVARLYAEADRAAFAHDIDLRNALAHGRVEVSGWRVRRDDSCFWSDVQLTALRDSEGRVLGYAHVISDKTERKQSEQELEEYRTRLEELVAERTRALHESMSRLRMSERMAALGTLSAGLGHDMGNLLLPIRLRLDAMQTKGVPDSLRDDVAAIATCADYLQRLSNGLRLLSIDPTQSNATPPSTDIDDWWADVQPFLRNALPKRIELERRMAAGLPPAAVPRHLLTQAVFNLVQNAGFAIPDETQGRVCVWAERGADSSTLRIGVTDNGTGMSDEVRARCLEPFFTSKTRAISTGLGLTLVHGVVQQVGGRIDIESEVGSGTTFALTLPVARANAEAARVRNWPLIRAVVDVADNRMRTYLGAVLRSVGFDVAYGPVPDNGAEVAIADAHVDSARIAAFLKTDPSSRRCLTIGWTSDAPLPDGVVQLSDRPSPATVRNALQNIARELDVREDQRTGAA